MGFGNYAKKGSGAKSPWGREKLVMTGSTLRIEKYFDLAENNDLNSI